MHWCRREERSPQPNGSFLPPGHHRHEGLRTCGPDGHPVPLTPCKSRRPQQGQGRYVENALRYRTMKGAILLTTAAASALMLLAAPGRAAQADPCPDNLNAPCERPLPPCSPVERPCQG